MSRSQFPDQAAHDRVWHCRSLARGTNSSQWAVFLEARSLDDIRRKRQQHVPLREQSRRNRGRMMWVARR